MHLYIPTFNDEVLFLNEKLVLPDNKLIQLVEILYSLNKRFKIEKIISFNNKNYEKEIKEILNNPKLELHNHYINKEEGYFHITFEKELIKDNDKLVYDSYCPYAISCLIDGNIDYQYYIELFNKHSKR